MFGQRLYNREVVVSGTRHAMVLKKEEEETVFHGLGVAVLVREAARLLMGP